MALINYFQQRGYPGTKVILTDENGGTPSGAVIPAVVIASPSTFAAVTPSDGTPLASKPLSLYIGGAGNLAVKGSDGVSATFAVIAGQTVNISPSFVLATGTTATGIVALN